jgi:hypothetical protein
MMAFVAAILRLATPTVTAVRAASHKPLRQFSLLFIAYSPFCAAGPSATPHSRRAAPFLLPNAGRERVFRCETSMFWG